MAGAATAHYAIALGNSPTLGALVALAPLALLLLLAFLRSRGRGPLPWLAVMAFAVALWLCWGALKRHFPSVYFVEDVAMKLVLGAMFGRTLVGNAEPLCTRFARLLHGELPPEVRRYTRQVTLAWTVFFLGMAALSCVLFLADFVAAWSVLANILTLPLVAAMFAVEYAIRLRVLKHWPHVGILEGLREFSRHSGAARVQTPL